MGLLGSSLGRALAAGGGEVSNVANKYIDADIANQKAQVLADLQRSTAANIARDAGQIAHEQAPTVLQDTLAAQAGAYGQKMGQERAELADTGLMSARNAADAAKAGAIATAQQDATIRDVQPGGILARGGNKIFENPRETSAEVMKGLYTSGLKGGPGAGNGLAREKFEAKEWAPVFKIEKDDVSYDDPVTGKPVQSQTMRNLYLKSLNEAKDYSDKNGGLSPQQARESAMNDLLTLRQAAEAKLQAEMARDKKSSMTFEQAAQAVVKERTQQKRLQDTGPPESLGNREPQGAAPSLAEQAKAAPAAAPADDGRVPDPPPAMMQQGIRQVPNPAYADWVRQYSEAYKKQQAAGTGAVDAAAAAARRSYNPYQQNRVP